MRYLDWRQLGVTGLITLLTGIAMAVTYVLIFTYETGVSMGERFWSGLGSAVTMLIAGTALVVLFVLITRLPGKEKDTDYSILIGVLAVGLVLAAAIFGTDWIGFSWGAIWPLLMIGPAVVQAAVVMMVVAWQINGSAQRTEDSRASGSGRSRQPVPRN